jgi:hypothetical protein
VCQLALDWLQANGSRAYLSTLTQADLDDLTAFPTRGALASARKASIRRIMMIYWKKIYTRSAKSTIACNHTLTYLLATFFST